MHIASWEDILKGEVSDIYFERSIEVIRKKNKDKYVVAEVKASNLPKGYKFGVLAGVEELAELLKTLNIKSFIMPEGSVFYEDEPVLLIEGNYSEFGIYETAILGLLCQASGVITKAARSRIAAKNSTVLSFGARRMHPALSLMIERCAYIGGLDGTSVKLAAKLLGLEPKGTMPHAFILVFQDYKEAFKAFDEVMPQNIPRIAIVDTLSDEKQEAIDAASLLNHKLFGVRIDTPQSRRGNVRQIIEEVRWELSLRGFKDVKIFLSGGIDEYRIAELQDIVDGFGIGTALSNAEVINFALDIVEVEGKPFAKRGKKSGKKQVYKCLECKTRRVYPFRQEINTCPACGSKNTFLPLLKPFTEKNKILQDLPNVHEIREYVLKQIEEEKLSL
jgi:nicotinate phosphoribosyltransferase